MPDIKQAQPRPQWNKTVLILIHFILSLLSDLPFLTIALKLFSDGLLQNEQQLKRFQNIDYYPVSCNSKLKLNLESINLNDAKIVEYSEISPHFNFLGGRRVHRGMCLIINQTFEQCPSLYRAGTMKDEQDLKTAWQYLGCRNFVQIKRDLNKVEMMEALKSFRGHLMESRPKSNGTIFVCLCNFYTSFQ